MEELDYLNKYINSDNTLKPDNVTQHFVWILDFLFAFVSSKKKSET